MEETVKQLVINVGSIIQILVNKNICTEEEFKEVNEIAEKFYDKKITEILKELKEKED